MKAKKCKALGCNRKTRTPFCWQHADMRDRGIKFGSTRHKNAMDEMCDKLRRGEWNLEKKSH